MIRSSKAPHRKITALAAVFGLLLQTAVAAFPFTLTVPGAFGPSAAGAVNPGDALRTVVICTGQGLKRLVLDAEGQPVEPPSGDSPSGFCPLCLTHAGCTLSSPAVAILLPAFIGRLAFPPQALTAGHGQKSKVYRNRAPPFRA
jgi:hypothetical protein